jgi:hypothetical protein
MAQAYCWQNKAITFYELLPFMLLRCGNNPNLDSFMEENPFQNDIVRQTKKKPASSTSLVFLASAIGLSSHSAMLYPVFVSQVLLTGLRHRR